MASGSSISSGKAPPPRVGAFERAFTNIAQAGNDKPDPPIGSGWNVTTLAIITSQSLKTCLWATLALYFLNQKHLLPKPLSAIVSKALFWPTMPLTLVRRFGCIGKYITTVDDTVVMGIAPVGFANLPELLFDSYNIRGVINMCQEYEGPKRKYEALGMDELWLPTVDHFDPSVEDLETAVSFIEQYRSRGEKVYVHCKAGHGRSAAVVFAWLLYRDPNVSRKKLNEDFCKKRHVRKTLWKQKPIIEFHSRVLGEVDIGGDE